MDKVFITGAGGFIGTHLSEKLCQIGYRVTNYDITGIQSNYHINNIQGNILDYDRLKSAMTGHKIVCHFAATVGNAKSFLNENEVYLADLKGVENIIRACKETGVENILFASTAEVYGEGSIDKGFIESIELKPKSPYGTTKMKAENLFMEYAISNNIKITIVRFSNVYGCGQRVQYVVPIFINKVIKGEHIYLCEKGQQIRNFIYIDDAVDGAIKAMLRAENSFEIFNITSDYAYRLLDLANHIISLNNNAGEIEFVSFEDVKRVRELEVMVSISSAKKAMDKLNFKACTNFERGLELTYEYYKNMLI